MDVPELYKKMCWCKKKLSLYRLLRLGGGRISLMAGRAADLNVSIDGAFTAEAGSRFQIRIALG